MEGGGICELGGSGLLVSAGNPGRQGVCLPQSWPYSYSAPLSIREGKHRASHIPKQHDQKISISREWGRDKEL